MAPKQERVNSQKLWHSLFKGSLIRDLQLQVFSWISVPVSHEDGFWKFVNESLSAVSMIPEIKDNYFEVKIFHNLFRASLCALYNCRMNFCSFFIFRYGKLILDLSAVSLTLLDSFLVLSFTSAINLWLFGYFWPVSMTPGNDTGDKLLWQ